MARIVVKKSDVVWNYVGTIVSMAGNFVLIPLLLVFLTEEEVGLWYVFIALSSFASLLEFGFTPTFARNIVYCISGARTLSKQGLNLDLCDEGIDWHLLRSVLRATKLVYATISFIALALALTLGTAYINHISAGIGGDSGSIAWLVFIAAIFMNLYFQYSLVYLRGVGDVAGENKAKTISRLGQLLLTALLLAMGFGLIGASIGFLASGIMLRASAIFYYKQHIYIQNGIKADCKKVTRTEVREVLGAVSYTAWRDGVVSVAWYGSTQAMTIICSLFLGLAETGTYSVMLQLATATYNISSAYMRSCFPTWQSAYVADDQDTQKWVVSRGLSCYYITYIVATAGIIVVLFPILPLFKPTFVLDVPLFLGISLYIFLLNHHSLFCSLIVGTNRIPYFKSYIVSALAGVVLSCAFCGVAKMGAWGLVLGQAIPQLVYNNWRWPMFVLRELNMSIKEIVMRGSAWWLSKVIKRSGSAVG